MQRLLEYLQLIYSEGLVKNKDNFERVSHNKRWNREEKVVEIFEITMKDCPNDKYKEYSFRVKGPQANNACYRISNGFYSFFKGKENVSEGIEYVLGCVIPIEGAIFADEFDRTTDAFTLYSAVHSPRIITKNRSKKYFYQYNAEKNIEISGDCDFNFHMQHVLYFENILETKNDLPEEERKELIEKLYYRYSELMYSPCNISIMPVTGGLNNTKKNIGNDRFDVFIYALKLYYENSVTSFLLSSGKQGVVYWNTILELKGYLNSFNGVNDYCKQVYHIEEDLVERLWKSGQKAIDSAERVKDYIDLADAVWAAKYKFYSETKNDKIKNSYDKIFKFVQQSKGKKIDYENEKGERVPFPRII